MKIQLDLDNKVIRLDSNVNIAELFETLKKLLPQGEWKEFDIETNTTIIWSNPYVYSPIVVPYRDPYPWWRDPIITYTDKNMVVKDGSTFELRYSVGTGIYNIEI